MALQDDSEGASLSVSSSTHCNRAINVYKINKMIDNEMLIAVRNDPLLYAFMVECKQALDGATRSSLQFWFHALECV